MEDVHLPLGDSIVEVECIRFHIGRRWAPRFEVVVAIDPTNQRRAIEAHRLAYVRGHVVDGQAHASVFTGIRSGAVHDAHVVQ